MAHDAAGYERLTETQMPQMTPAQRKTLDELMSFRVLLRRLAHRLGNGQHNAVVSDALHRLKLAEQTCMRKAERGSLPFGRVFAARDVEEAARVDIEGEMEGDTRFECALVLVGKGGVGKSPTVNSIFDRPMTPTLHQQRRYERL